MPDPSSMASAETAPDMAFPDGALWDSLKRAIAQCSGFQSWCSEQPASTTANTSAEKLVRLYLLETLETLAY